MHKNIFVEEYAGLREISYKKFEFNPNTVLQLLAFLAIPGTLFYLEVINEAVSFWLCLYF